MMLTHKRRRPRGAMLVEALIVISVFIVCLSVAIWFRMVYLEKLANQDYARAGTLAFAMTGCQGDPAAALTPDMGTRTSTSGSQTGQAPKSNVVGGNAGAPLQKVTGSNDATVANQVTSVNVSRKLTLSNGKSSVPGDTIFSQDVGSISYVSCGDPLPEDGANPYDGIGSEVGSALGGLF